jgi:hypothetical protein
MQRIPSLLEATQRAAESIIGAQSLAIAGAGNHSGWLFASDNEPRTVTTQRRRRSSTPSGDRERADAPTRDQRPPSSSGGSRPPSSGGGGYSSGGGGSSYRPPLGGGGRPGNPLLLIGLVVVLLLCVGPFMLFGGGFGGGDSGGNGGVSQSVESLPEAAAPVIATARPAQQSQPAPSVNLTSTGDPSQKWLIMLYQDADDKILEKDIFIDLNEAERIGSNDQVQIVSQLDRYRGGLRWRRRLARHQAATMSRKMTTWRASVRRMVEDLGEVNMASGDTLVDFVTWAVEQLPGGQVRADPLRPRHGLARRLERPEPRPRWQRRRRRAHRLHRRWATRCIFPRSTTR